MKLISKVVQQITHFLAPPLCAACRTLLHDYDVFCDPCYQKIQPVASHELTITATKSMRVIAAGAYQDPLKQLVLAKGYANPTASAQLAKFIWHATTVKQVPFDYLVPVPLHWTRFAWRGYNQAHEIARVLSRLSGKPILHLQRVQRTMQQSCFKREDRLRNVASAFNTPPSVASTIKGSHILIVDDLLTSGATLTAVAKELYSHRIAQATALVGARVV